MRIRKIEQRDDLERTFMRQNPEKYEESIYLSLLSILHCLISSVCVAAEPSLDDQFHSGEERQTQSELTEEKQGEFSKS
jgi:hypothetical protein